MAVTEYLDLKLLAQTLIKDEPKIFIDIDKLLKREEMLKKEEEQGKKQ
jgi:hypothetical protein